MKSEIFFDATLLAFGGDLRGIPQVICQLVRLFRADPAFAGIRYISTPQVTRDHLEKWGIPRDRIDHVAQVPLLGRFERFFGLFSTFRYRALARRAGLIIHPELRTVLRSDVPQMVFHYDFIIFDPPAAGESRKWARYACYAYKNRQAARARFKVAISEATRRRALELYPSIRPESISARLLGIRMRPASGPRSAPAADLPLNFLYVGSYEARKNIPALLTNLGAVAAGRRAVLHLAGNMRPPQREALTALASALPQGLEAKFHGLVGDEELLRLYRDADFLLFPSLSEGFGLPLIEAMAQGVVVCAFRNSSLPEVGGDAAIFAADGDFAAWGKSITALAADPAAYAEASRRGLARAAGFTEAKMHERYKACLLEAFGACGLSLRVAEQA